MKKQKLTLKKTLLTALSVGCLSFVLSSNSFANANDNYNDDDYNYSGNNGNSGNGNSSNGNKDCDSSCAIQSEALKSLGDMQYLNHQKTVDLNWQRIRDDTDWKVNESNKRTDWLINESNRRTEELIRNATNQGKSGQMCGYVELRINDDPNARDGRVPAPQEYNNWDWRVTIFGSKFTSFNIWSRELDPIRHILDSNNTVMATGWYAPGNWGNGSNWLGDPNYAYRKVREQHISKEVYCNGQSLIKGAVFFPGAADRDWENKRKWTILFQCPANTEIIDMSAVTNYESVKAQHGSNWGNSTSYKDVEEAINLRKTFKYACMVR